MTIHKLPAAMDDAELLAELGAEAPGAAPAEPMRDRWARLMRDCEARRAREGFRVLDGGR